MRSGTNLGKRSSPRLEKIAIAIIGVLVQSSRYEDKLTLQLGLMGLKSVSLTSEQVAWVTEKLVKPKSLASTHINSRLPQKYKLHPQQITRIVRRFNKDGYAPGKIVSREVHARKEFYIDSPSIPQNLLFVE